jgi:hypothetical protein
MVVLHHNVRRFERALFVVYLSMLLKISQASFLGYSLRHVITLRLDEICRGVIEVRVAVLKRVNWASVIIIFETEHISVQHLLIESSLRQILVVLVPALYHNRLFVLIQR